MLTSDTDMYSLFRYGINQLLNIRQEFDVIVLHDIVLEYPFFPYYINDSGQLTQLLSYFMTV